MTVSNVENDCKVDDVLERRGEGEALFERVLNIDSEGEFVEVFEGRDDGDTDDSSVEESVTFVVAESDFNAIEEGECICVLDTLLVPFDDTDSTALADFETVGETLNEACVAVRERVA